jgi:hypothetical protein
MKTQALPIILLLIILSCIGCSHRVAVTGSSSSRLVRTTPRVGDRAEYSTIDDTQVMAIRGMPIQSKMVGREVVTVLAGDNHGRPIPPYIVRTYEIRCDNEIESGGRDKSWTDSIWCGEDRLGNIYLLAESQDGVTWDLVKDARPPIVMPYKINIGDSWSYVAHLSSGGTESLDMKCICKEKLKTPVGEYEAYKISENTTSTDLGVSMSGYIWIAPSLPFVFELKRQNSGESSAQGIPATVSTEYMLQELSLSP